MAADADRPRAASRPRPQRAAELELRFTRHGPVIYQDEKKHVAIALRWAGSEPGGAAYLGGLSVARAENRQQFVKALESWKVPGLNFVYADVDGDIGWVATALTPIRKGWDGLLAGAGRGGQVRVARLPAGAGLAADLEPAGAFCRDGQSQHPAGGLSARDRVRMVVAVPLPADQGAAGARRSSSRSPIFRAFSTTAPRCRDAALARCWPRWSYRPIWRRWASCC